MSGSAGSAVMTGASGATDDDREELRRSVRRFLAAHSPESVVRTLMDSETSYDSVLWKRVVSELGLTAMVVPEVYGGIGFGFTELGIVFEEFGAALFVGPLFSTMLSTTALLTLADDDAKERLLHAIAAGTELIAYAAVGSGAAHNSEALQIVDHGVEQVSVTGYLDIVVDGSTADRLLVLASDGQSRLRLLEVDAADVSVDREVLVSMDLTRRLASVRLSQTPARDIGSSDLGPEAVELAHAQMSVMLSSEQLGAMSAALDLTLDYVKTRVQFGRTIGSFQAIKHRCADLALEVEVSRSTNAAAVRALDRSAPDLLIDAHLAAATCSDNYLQISRAMLQLHGGIGFTWEHVAHLHLKRAKTSQLILGTPVSHRRQIARQLGIIP